MRKSVLIFGIVFISLILFSQGLWAQRIYRDDPRAADPFALLNLTQEQMAKIDKLDLDLENELSPMFSQLRSAYFDLDEMEYQRNPDQTAIDKQWAMIQKLEIEIQNKEALYDEKIQSVLTREQLALLDSYTYQPGRNFYGRSGYGQGFYGRGGGRGNGRGYYTYGRNRTARGPGTGYVGRGAGYAGRGAGYAGRGAGYAGRGAGYAGRGAGYAGRGAGRMRSGYYSNYGPSRLGRGPCGAGLGRWYRWNRRD